MVEDFITLILLALVSLSFGLQEISHSSAKAKPQELCLKASKSVFGLIPRRLLTAMVYRMVFAFVIGAGELKRHSTTILQN